MNTIINGAVVKVLLVLVLGAILYGIGTVASLFGSTQNDGRQAVESLRKVSAAVKSGTTFDNYTRLVGDARYEVDKYAESNKTKKDQLKHHTTTACLFYEDAIDSWGKQSSRMHIDAAERQTEAAYELLKARGW